MKNILLRLCTISLGAFFIGAQAYHESLFSSEMVYSMKAMAIRPQLKSAQTHLRVMRQEYTKDWPDLKPVPKDVLASSGFGIRMHPIYKRRLMHWGVDFPVMEGTKVKAAASGLVVKVVSNHTKSSYGKYIVIAHDDEHKTLYAHLSRIYVKQGTWIEKGAIIARSGNTGISTSPHLHFEVIENGKRINPLRILKGDAPPPF